LYSFTTAQPNDKYVAFSVTWMTMGGHTLIFGARTLSCNSGIFSRPLTYTKTWHDTTREPQDFLPREDRAAELETMGGDPLFLSDASDDNDDRLETPLTEDEGSSESILSPFMMAASALSVKSLFKGFVILRLGRSPMESPHFQKKCKQTMMWMFWEWYGMVDENAHTQLDD
jgi:hypothetical protein